MRTLYIVYYIEKQLVKVRQSRGGFGESKSK